MITIKYVNRLTYLIILTCLNNNTLPAYRQLNEFISSDFYLFIEL